MFLFYRICVRLSHFDVIFRLSIFVPIFDGVEWSVATVPEHSEMISLTTRIGNVAASRTRSGGRGRFLRRRTHHAIVMKPDGTTVLCNTSVPGRGGASAPHYSMIRICTSNYHHAHLF
jgi:hypothetical protein